MFWSSLLSAGLWSYVAFFYIYSLAMAGTFLPASLGDEVVVLSLLYFAIYATFAAPSVLFARHASMIRSIWKKGCGKQLKQADWQNWPVAQLFLGTVLPVIALVLAKPPTIIFALVLPGLLPYGIAESVIPAICGAICISFLTFVFTIIARKDVYSHRKIKASPNLVTPAMATRPIGGQPSAFMGRPTSSNHHLY